MTQTHNKRRILSYKQTRLESSNIKYNDYTRTLLSELERLGLITPEQLAQIRNGVMETLSEVIGWKTGGESSSIMTETANDLLLSVLFTVDAYLLGAGSVDGAVNLLLNTPVIQLYYEGIRRLKLYLCETTGLLVRVKRTRIKIPNVYYNQTVDTFITSLKNYDIKFGAHRISGDIDYPLAVPNGAQRGIHYLRGYLMNLYAENSFCREYDGEEVQKLYILFCDKHKYPYTEPLVNIYSIVFANALFNDYLRKEPGSLMITEDECGVIEMLLESMQDEERKNLLSGAAAKMIGGNALYNAKNAARIMPEIQNAIKNKKLKNYLVTIK